MSDTALDSNARTRWQCTVCNHIHEGDAPPDECPVCQAPASKFVKLAADRSLTWHKVAELDVLPDGRVTTVLVEGRSYALTHFEGLYALLDNGCPHEGGPLGEGAIENGILRCPWHGWDYHPTTGKAPGYDDGVIAHPTEVRDDGVYAALGAAPERPRTVADVMMETMVNWGVTHVFGMVGHSNLGLAEAIRRQEAAGKLRYIGIRHEGAASFAASAYAKLTGKPAACLSIAGPGATNLLTGLWDARMDRAPVLALTGQVDAQVLGPGAFQEVDLAAAFAPVAAWSQTVLPGSKHAELMTLALKHACLRRDVAHLIFPDEVQTLPAGDETPAGSPEGRLAAQEISPSLPVLEDAIGLLREHKRPVIIVGHGARFHLEPIIGLAETLGCPVLTTFKGKGLIPDDHPLAGGVLGRSGTPVGSHFMNASDLLLVFGASFSKHTGIIEKRPIIQVDFDPLALGKSHPVRVPLYGEIGVTARLLGGRLKAGGEWTDQRAELAERWAIWRDEKAQRATRGGDGAIHPAAIFAAFGRHCPADAVIAVDVGNNTYSFGRYFECQRQSVLMSGYLGSIGFGYPAAMGAWAGAPERPIVAITGDGGFGQYLGELTTAVKYGMPIKHVLLNNGELGKITKEQLSGQFPVWQTSLHNPDFAGYAELCGAKGFRVERASALDEALAAAFATDGPALVEVLTSVSLL